MAPIYLRIGVSENPGAVRLTIELPKSNVCNQTLWVECKGHEGSDVKSTIESIFGAISNVREGANNISSAGQILARADKARDARAWDEARSLYRQFLAKEPNRADIWVQLGHAAKESGHRDEAQSAYLRAIEIAPEVADTHLQLGHLLKLIGEIEAAMAAYQRAFELDPRLADAKRELQHLGFDSEMLIDADSPTLESSTTRLVLDLSDVFFYLRHHDTVSGIQRVQLGIAEAILSQKLTDQFQIVFITGSDDGGFIEIDNDYLRNIVSELKKQKVSHEKLKGLISSAGQNGYTFRCRKGDVILMLGAFWVLFDVIERCIRLKNEGAVIGVLIHDIIPITHSEYCDDSLSDSFYFALEGILEMSDFILTVSDHSGKELTKYIEKFTLPKPPIRTLHQAHQTMDTPRPSRAVSKRVKDIMSEPYVLYVSTIEIRKNHIYLFRIWKMLQRAGDVPVPRLIFVGRAGWRVSDLMEQIKSTNGLDGRIRLIHGLSDVELAELYRHAQFTVFPSLEEGWGLPVGESLIFGRPCVASNSSSVPEVGGDLVDYVDPLNVTEGYNVIRRFIVDEAYREHRAERIKREFKPRRWHDVAIDMIDSVSKITQARGFRSLSLTPPVLESGKVHKNGHSNNRVRFIRKEGGKPIQFAFDSNWYPIETSQRWLRGNSGQVAFSVKSLDRSPAVVVMISYEVPPWIGQNRIEVFAGDEVLGTFDLEPSTQRRIMFTAPVVENTVRLRFEVRGEINRGDDPRPHLCFAVRAFGYAPVADALARVALLESSIVMAGGFSNLSPVRRSYDADAT